MMKWILANKTLMSNSRTEPEAYPFPKVLMILGFQPKSWNEILRTINNWLPIKAKVRNNGQKVMIYTKTQH